MGETETALAITSAVVNQVYSGGLQFRTPEAITAVNTFRACHYLRAMAIWGSGPPTPTGSGSQGRSGAKRNHNSVPYAGLRAMVLWRSAPFCVLPSPC